MADLKPNDSKLSGDKKSPTDKRLFWLFVISVLLITKFAFIFPPNIINIFGFVDIEEIGLGILLILFIWTYRKKSEIPGYVKISYLVLLAYVGIQIIRSMYLYDQTFIETLKTEKHLLYGLLIFVTPKIIEKASDLKKLLKILTIFSIISAISFLIQAVLKRSFFNGYYQLNDIGGVTLFRAFDIFPLILIFISFGIVYLMLNRGLTSREGHGGKNYIILLILALIPLAINATRSEWIAYAIVIIVILFISKSKYKIQFLISIAAIILILGSVSFISSRANSIFSDVKQNGGTFGYRYDVVVERLNLIKHVSIPMGAGLVAYENHIYDNYFTAGDKTSNDVAVSQADIGYSGIIGQLGIIGLLLYAIHIMAIMYYFGITFKHTENLERKAIMCAFIGISVWMVIITFANFGVYGRDVAVLYLAVGLVWSVRNHESKYKELKNDLEI